MNLNKKKWVSVLLAAALCIAMCGCAAQTASVTIYPDGSGTVIAKAGMTEEAIQQYEEIYGVSTGQEDMAAFYLNGKTYYGAMDSKVFQNTAELDAEFFNIDRSDVFPEADVPIGFGEVKLTSEQGGGYRLEVETKEVDDVEANLPAVVWERYQVDGSSGYRQVLTFSFPGIVRQVSGGTKGITMNGSILVLDYVLMAQNEGTQYTFLADAGEKEDLSSQKQQRFIDVPTDLWSYPAIEQMAAGGMVSGYGNGLFGPHDAITVAQFCQVLARANGFETGAGETGWWAETAVASCLAAGYVAERGKVLEINYSLPITREEAIAAMQLASGRPALPDKDYTLSEIPDAQDITVAYRDLIVAAYNSGITKGVDAQGTFLPQRTLTRGEICQLFYNLGWTEAQAR